MPRFSAVAVLAALLPLVAEASHAATTTATAHDGAPAARSDNRPSGLAMDSDAAPDPARPGADLFDPATMMRADDVRPGMKGYGLTVFSGIRPERFDAEVVGVRHRVFPGQDIILCRLSSPHLADIGVIAGMSGSPVYMDGRLIGAVAYGWSNSKEALAGVTPIDAMLDVFASTGETTATADGGVSGDGERGSMAQYEAYLAMRETMELGRLPRVEGPSDVSIRISDLSGVSPAALDGVPDQITMRPLAAPLFMSSAAPATLAVARAFFAGTGVEPVPASLGGGGASSARAENSPGGPVTDLAALADELAGGYALAIPMVEGDLNMAGVGTVTWRKGDRLVAFGHPMFQFGPVEFPMAPARVNALVRSSVRPFKLGEPLGQVGVIRQDRLPAVGGQFGQPLPMIPVRASVVDAGYRGLRRFEFSVIRHRDLTPGLVMTALAESIAAAGRSGGDTAAMFRYSVATEDGTSFTKENYISDPNGGIMAAMAAGTDVGVLVTNPFRRTMASTVELDVRLMDKLPEARLLRAGLDREAYRPGETATVEWVLTPFRREPVTMRHSFVLPANLPDGSYAVSVGDGPSRLAAEVSRNPGGSRILDYDGLVRVVSRNFPRNKVYVTLLDGDTGAAVHGQEMPRLPGSVVQVLRDGTEQPYYADVRGNFLVDADVATEYEVRGEQAMTLRVKRRPD